MSVLIPRIRTINVRLSEEEYLALERFCVASGARSISDLVRSAMHSLVTGANQESALASSVNQYSTHVRSLEHKVEDLAAQLASFKAGMQPGNVSGTDEGTEIAEEKPLVDIAPSSTPD
ncbi:MAG TPA: hypothetical protein VG267_18705 [Terracidiphilus sp.]|jgi:hypothetical protein|nr:hypothetical protein [Terracidiphilus sp.]